MLIPVTSNGKSDFENSPTLHVAVTLQLVMQQVTFQIH